MLDVEDTCVRSAGHMRDSQTFTPLDAGALLIGSRRWKEGDDLVLNEKRRISMVS